MKKAHFIGICGIGMSATAVLLKEWGWEVTGSDSGAYPPANEYLARHGIVVHESYRKENIPKDAELIVIGKNAKLTQENNEEVRAAFASGISIRSFPEVVGQLFADKANIVVAGSYGKSTITALLAWCFSHAGKPARPGDLGRSGGDPSYFIGARPRNFAEHAHLGDETVAILEGDEYPSSNWDESSKFLHYHPHDVLLTAAEHDHVNVFPTLEEYLVPYKKLLSLLPPEGLLVACSDEPNAAALAHTHPGYTITYGLGTSAQWHPQEITYGEHTAFVLMHNDAPVTTLTTPLLGAHNVQNIVGASAMLLEKELITPEALQSAVATFEGIQRRLDRKTTNTSVLVYEGFGSSYKKAQAAISAMKLHFPDRRLIILFEPYEFSWRDRQTLHWYEDIFAPADVALIYQPPTHGAATHDQLTHEEIVEAARHSGVETRPIKLPEEGVRMLKELLQPSDVILMMSSGTIGGLIEAVPQLVKDTFPENTTVPTS